MTLWCFYSHRPETCGCDNRGGHGEGAENTENYYVWLRALRAFSASSAVKKTEKGYTLIISLDISINARKVGDTHLSLCQIISTAVSMNSSENGRMTSCF